MLDNETRRRIDSARDILVGKVPDPKSQVEQITIALIYKFMDDMDREAVEMGGKATFFTGEYEKYGWSQIFNPRLGGYEMLALYADAITRMTQNPGIPQLFRDIFKNAYLPYRDPETLKLFLKTVDEFRYDHSERLGDAFEYLLSVLGSQGDAGQFRTPRHIIDFMVEIVDPKKHETILDPACGTAGFLVSAYKHILNANSSKRPGDLLNPEERNRLLVNFKGYDISPDMVRLSLVNLYLHGFVQPQIYEYDTLSREERWSDYADVVLANPPFMSPKGGIKPHKRFTVQSNRSEVLFVDYIAEHLTPAGRGAVIVPEGIIFQSAGAYRQLRKYLIEENFLVAVISLPAGVFNPYSGVKTSILVFDRGLARKASGVLFLKIQNDGYGLGAQRRQVAGSELPAAAGIMRDWFASLRSGASFSPSGCGALVVEKSRLAENGEYNLTGERYREVVRRGGEKWERVRLGEVIDRIVETVDPQSLSGKVKYIGLENISQNDGILVGEIITDAKSIKSLKSSFQADDILYGKLRPNLNKVLLCEFDGICSTDILVLRSTSKIIPDYLSYVLRSSYFNAKVLTGLGGAQLPRVSYDFFRNIQIPLPPLEIQREIVAKIEEYQKVIDGARQVVKSWAPKIDIDPACPVIKIGDLCTRIQYGISNPMNTDGCGYKTFRMNELVEGYCVDSGNMKYSSISVEEFNNYRLKKGDILFNRTNSIEHVGRTGIFNLPGDYCFASYLIRLTILTEKADPFYINTFMNTEHFQRGIKQFASRAIGQANINAKSLSDYLIPNPSPEIQREIVTKIEAERKIVDGCRELIALYEAKIKQVIDKVWEE